MNRTKGIGEGMHDDGKTGLMAAAVSAIVADTHDIVGQLAAQQGWGTRDEAAVLSHAALGLAGLAWDLRKPGDDAGLRITPLHSGDAAAP